MSFQGRRSTAQNSQPSMGNFAPLLATLSQLCRLLLVVPPGLGNSPKIARPAGRPAEYVPIRDPVRGLVPVRDPVPACSNDAIECLTGGGEFGTCLGCDNSVNERVHRRISDPCEILRPFRCRRLR